VIVLENKIKSLEEVIKDTSSWLINSGLQNLDSNRLEVKGGFNSWYDLKNKDYFYAYSEVAGYGISTLLFLSSVYKNNIYLTRAILAAEWLLDKAFHKSGGLKTRYYYDREKAPEQYDFSSGIIHSFDNGMALSGLIELYKVTNEERYYKTAKKVSDLLVDLMQKKDGSLYASYSHKDETFKDNFDKWSTQSGSYHAKVAIGLLKMYEISKDDKYKDAVIKLCNNSLSFQEESGRFISFKKEGDTNLHPHCYSAEGLLFAGLKLKNKIYLDSFAKATTWALDSQMENGGIPSMNVNNRFVGAERSDVLGQVLRLGTIGINLGLIDKRYEERLSRLASRLISFQHKSDDVRSNGGFVYGDDINYHENLKSEKKDHLNSWCTMFALQSLSFYKDYLEKKLVFDEDIII